MNESHLVVSVFCVFWTVSKYLIAESFADVFFKSVGFLLSRIFTVFTVLHTPEDCDWCHGGGGSLPEAAQGDARGLDFLL